MPSDAPPHASVPARMAVAFAALLRSGGVDVALGSVLLFVEALDRVGIDTRVGVYWAGRATLVHHPEHLATYDRAFATFWLQRERITTLQPAEQTSTLAFDEGTGGSGDDQLDDDEERHDVRVVRYSPVEVLRHKDFAAYTHGEFDEARRLMADLRLGGALRRTRRLRAARPRTRRTAHPDLRRTLHRSLKLHGEPLHRLFLEPAERQRRLVLLCDVSGSMEPYTRALLRFLHAAVVGRRHVEAFVLGTRVTRLTRELANRDPDAAFAAAGAAVDDWSGGTRLGSVLRAFNDRYGVRGMARGAVVVILSDGWDRGPPDELGAQMARLRRVAHRIVWVNPLKATPGYQPLARGMVAALPYVDEFVEGHSLASLEQLAKVIATP